jgi:hypothetical protein
MNPIQLLLNPWTWLIIILIFASGAGSGAWINNKLWLADIAEKEKEIAKKYQQRVEKSNQIEVKAVDNAEKIKIVFRDREVIKYREVPNAVIVRQDSNCVIPNRFVSMWDSANRAETPTAASLLDETPSGIKLSDIEQAKEREAELCHANTEQVKGLQEYIRTVCSP